MATVPFKTPVDYWVQALGRDPANINRFPLIQRENPEWTRWDNDLHVYPHTRALPAMLSVGCPNRCAFCPTAAEHKGKVTHGDPEIILPYYEGSNVHFMDENFFYNDMASVLALTRRLKIQWLAMSDYSSTMRMFEEYGPGVLWDCGCRCIEIGLENIALMRKVKEPVPKSFIEIYYLNMTLLPGETKETIRENGIWMRENSLRRPIHFNNGMWYAPGQFYYPYQDASAGIVLGAKWARTRPTYVPDSLLEQKYFIDDLEGVNFYSQLVYGMKIYPEEQGGTVREFASRYGSDGVAWLCVGLRAGVII